MLIPSRVRALTVAIVMAVLAAGCGSSGPAGESAASPSAAEPTSRTVVDGKGNTVEVPTNPQRALGFYTTDVDILITLGIPLAPIQPIRGEGYTEFPPFFPLDKLAGITTFGNFPEYNFEKVLEGEPDLILNGLGYDADTVKRLPEIAPTYTVDAFDGKDWRIHFKNTAEAFGRTAEHDAWTAGYQARLDQAKADIAAAGAADLTVAGFSYYDGTASISCYGVPCLAFDDLGLPQSPLQDDPDLRISAEQLGKLKDVDAVFMGTLPGPDGQKEHDALIDQLNKIPTWRSLPFVKNNRIYTYDMEMVYGSPSGHTAFLEVVRKALTQP